MTEFTKGKWVYDEPFVVIFSHETCEVIAHVQGAGTGSCFCSTQEGQANARLIAAAPEMYKALIFAMVSLRDGDAHLQIFADNIHELLARIDGKIKGGESECWDLKI